VLFSVGIVLPAWLVVGHVIGTDVARCSRPHCWPAT
jgi:hypothetical protein